jgi:hypothetical protein
MVDVVVEGSRETLHLAGRVLGELTMVFTMANCGGEKRNTKQMPHPAC